MFSCFCTLFIPLSTGCAQKAIQIQADVRSGVHGKVMTTSLLLFLCLAGMHGLTLNFVSPR
jgi:hypothetical protein